VTGGRRKDRGRGHDGAAELPTVCTTSRPLAPTKLVLRDGDVLRSDMAPVALLALLVVIGVACRPPVQVEHGSLIIGVPVVSGWVVCGDTRKNSSLVAATDDEVKVFSLPGGIVAGATGLRRVIEGDVLFDVADGVSAFVRTRPFDGQDDYIEALARFLSDEFVRTVPQRIWPSILSSADRGPSVFTVMLFWVTDEGLPRWADLNFHLRGGPRYATRTTWDVLATSNALRPVVIGNLAVVDELQHGSRPDFDRVRAEAGTRRFLREPYAWRERHADEAEAFGRALILFTSQRLGDLQTRPVDVGPIAQCVRVERPTAATTRN